MQFHQTLSILTSTLIWLKSGTITLQKFYSNNVRIESLNVSLNSLKMPINNEIQLHDCNSNNFS